MAIDFAETFAFKLENSGAALARRVAAPSAANCKVPCQPWLRLLQSVNIGYRNGVTAHVKAEVARLAVDSPGCVKPHRHLHVRRSIVQAELRYVDGPAVA